MINQTKFEELQSHISRNSIYAIIISLLVIGGNSSLFGIQSENDTNTFDNSVDLTTTHLNTPKIAQVGAHDPISLTSNSALQTTALAESWEGDGSLEDPIIIQNYLITAVSTGIYLYNISLHVKIDNVFLQTSTALNGYGIDVDSCENIVVESCQFFYLYFGCRFINTKQSEVINSYFENCYEGLAIYGGAFNHFGDNEFNNQFLGINIYQSSNTTVFQNNITGIHSYGGSSGIRINNAYNISLEGNYLFDMVFNGAYNGMISLDNSNNITIFNNTIENCTIYGFSLMYSEDVLFHDNYLADIPNMLVIGYCDSITIMRNTFLEFTRLIECASIKNIIIYQNNFINFTTTITFYDEEITMIWYNGEIGNYWSDKPVNDTRYYVGTFAIIDLYDEYPYNRMIDFYPPKIEESPLDVSFRERSDDPPVVNWTVSDENPEVLEIYIDKVLVNSTTWETGYSELELGTLNFSFKAGTYEIEFCFYDIDNNSASFTFQAQVNATFISSGLNFVAEQKLFFIAGGAGLGGLAILLIILKSKKKNGKGTKKPTKSKSRVKKAVKKKAVKKKKK